MLSPHLNYNHLYYFWQVCKTGSVSGAAEALCLTPQTVTGQIKALEDQLKGKLLKRSGRGVVPSELGQLVFRYADKMFTLSSEMLDIVNYSKDLNLMLDVGVADALSKRLVSSILQEAVNQNENIMLRCFESTHEMLLEQLSHHKLDMILSDCPVDSTQSEGLYSLKLGECDISFFCCKSITDILPFPQCLSQRKLLIPGRRTMLGRKIANWLANLDVETQILGEFDDVALMKAFGLSNDVIFVAPSFYLREDYAGEVIELGRIENLSDEYYVIFAERMIQHSAVQRLCNHDFSDLFKR